MLGRWMAQRRQLAFLSLHHHQCWDEAECLLETEFHGLDIAFPLFYLIQKRECPDGSEGN